MEITFSYPHSDAAPSLSQTLLELLVKFTDHPNLHKRITNLYSPQSCKFDKRHKMSLLKRIEKGTGQASSVKETNKHAPSSNPIRSKNPETQMRRAPGSTQKDAFKELKERIQDKLVAELDPTMDISRTDEVRRTIQDMYEQILTQEKNAKHFFLLLLGDQKVKELKTMLSPLGDKWKNKILHLVFLTLSNKIYIRLA